MEDGPYAGQWCLEEKCAMRIHVLCLTALLLTPTLAHGGQYVTGGNEGVMSLGIDGQSQGQLQNQRARARVEGNDIVVLDVPDLSALPASSCLQSVTGSGGAAVPSFFSFALGMGKAQRDEACDFREYVKLLDAAGRPDLAQAVAICLDPDGYGRQALALLGERVSCEPGKFESALFMFPNDPRITRAREEAELAQEKARRIESTFIDNLRKDGSPEPAPLVPREERHVSVAPAACAQAFGIGC